MQRRLMWFNALTILIALAWFVNGFFCKLLNLVPRHQQIVARILGDDHAVLLTKSIGFLEVLLAVWILSKWYHRLCTVVQIAAVASMNIIEFILVPDLLLFGRCNIIVAIAFIAVLIAHERLQPDQSSGNFRH